MCLKVSQSRQEGESHSQKNSVLQRDNANDIKQKKTTCRVKSSKVVRFQKYLLSSPFQALSDFPSWPNIYHSYSSDAMFHLAGHTSSSTT